MRASGRPPACTAQCSEPPPAPSAASRTPSASWRSPALDGRCEPIAALVEMDNWLQVTQGGLYGLKISPQAWTFESRLVWCSGVGYKREEHSGHAAESDPFEGNHCDCARSSTCNHRLHKHMKQTTCGPPKSRPESTARILKESISEIFLKSNISAVADCTKAVHKRWIQNITVLTLPSVNFFLSSQSSRIDLTLFGMFV
jgi:hypothetical protein